MFFLILALSAIFNYSCGGDALPPITKQKFILGPQDFEEPLRTVLYKIESDNLAFLVESGCRGDGSLITNAEKNFERLARTANKKELLRITNCSNPTIRSMALGVLLQMPDVDAADLLTKHVFDSAVVYEDYNFKPITVISLVLHDSRYWRSEKQRNAFANLMLSHAPNELASYWILGNDRFSDTFPGYYEVVRKMAAAMLEFRYKSLVDWYAGMAAVERLARYKKDSDTTLLSELIAKSMSSENDDRDGKFWPYSTIKIFPSTAFDKFYQDTTQYQWIRQLRFLSPNYNSGYYSFQSGMNEFVDLVAARKTEKSARLLDLIFETPIYKHLNLLFTDRDSANYKTLRHDIGVAIRENPSPLYKDLLLKTERYLNREYDYQPGDSLGAIYKLDTVETGSHLRSVRKRDGWLEALIWY